MSLYKGRKGGATAKSARGPVIDSRAVALGGLAAVRQGHNLPEGMAQAGMSSLSLRDRAFARRLALHAVRHRRRLETQMAGFLQRPTKDGLVSDLLWLGAAQIDMDDVADHAAVNSTVDLAPKRVRGLVNAILRRCLREPPAAPSSPAVRLSYPDWLFAAISKTWPKQSNEILEALNQEPPQVLRVNRQYCDRDVYQARLAETGVQAEAVGNEGLVLSQTTALTELPGFEEGGVSMQGASAQFAAGLMDLEPGQWVFDACAAPGGKTVHMLELQPDIHCVAMDLDAQRLLRVAENLERLGLSAELHAGHAGRSGPWQRDYDRILLDAPCSGTGVIGRHPDIKWLRRAADIPQLQEQQGELLSALWPLLKSGGKLLYCTCSILDAENDQVIEQFLSAHPDARTESIKLPSGHASAHGWRVPPQAPYEGFYYARLIKG